MGTINILLWRNEGSRDIGQLVSRFIIDSILELRGSTPMTKSASSFSSQT